MPYGLATPTDARAAIRALCYAEEGPVVRELVARIGLDPAERKGITAAAAELVERVRERSSPTMMEAFLAEYGLPTDEGEPGA